MLLNALMITFIKNNMIRASIKFNEQDLGTVKVTHLIKSLTQDMAQEPQDRSKAVIKKLNKGFELRITAKDVVSLRATLNLYLRLISMIKGLGEVLK